MTFPNIQRKTRRAPTSMIQSARRVAAAMLAIAIAAGSAGSALGQAASAEERAEVFKLVRERDTLHRELQRLDRQAADAIKRGEEPIDLHARQVNTEDRLDLVTLRLEILATRYELPIPALPGEQPVRIDPERVKDDDAAAQRSLARGRSRAMAQMRSDADQFLMSLEFGEFLELDD